jgi:hypothetical protein
MKTRDVITKEAVIQAIPRGRFGYVMAGHAVRETEPTKANSYGVVYEGPNQVTLRGLKNALYSLADAHRAEELVPPLPDDLATIITDAADDLREVEGQYAEFTPSYGESRVADALKPHREAVELAIVAALDHGRVAR